MRDAVNRQMPLGRRHQRLRDVAAATDFLENALGQLVAAIGGLAAVAGSRFEEPLFACGPEVGGIVGGHFARGRHARLQQFAVCRADADFGKPVAVAEQDEITLVGIQRMRARMRREHHGVGQIRITQGLILRIIEGKSVRRL